LYNIYIKVNFCFNLERNEIAQFLQQIWTKLRQKLKYNDQFENEEMTPRIIVTRDIINAISHCYCHVA